MSSVCIVHQLNITLHAQKLGDLSYFLVKLEDFVTLFNEYVIRLRLPILRWFVMCPTHDRRGGRQRHGQLCVYFVQQQTLLTLFLWWWWIVK